MCTVDETVRFGKSGGSSRIADRADKIISGGPPPERSRLTLVNHHRLIQPDCGGSILREVDDLGCCTKEKPGIRHRLATEAGRLPPVVLAGGGDGCVRPFFVGLRTLRRWPAHAARMHFSQNTARRSYQEFL